MSSSGGTATTTTASVIELYAPAVAVHMRSNNDDSELCSCYKHTHTLQSWACIHNSCVYFRGSEIADISRYANYYAQSIAWR
jgi:hypothetical protein